MKRSRDFTLEQYEKLVVSLQKRGFRSCTPDDYCEHNEEGRTAKMVFLRHDVDKPSGSVLEIARLEHTLGMKGLYYFRSRGGEFDADTITTVKGLGHVIGYHYETLSRARGKPDKALSLFLHDLAKLRDITEVTTVCKHGSPFSKWDNGCLWDHYDYRDFGIAFEPYCDLDFEQILYLTDTGRRWDGASFSVRDKVSSSLNFRFRTTQEIIDNLGKPGFPDLLMINSHPHRWSSRVLPWFKELVWQNSKNLIKWFRIKMTG